MKKTLLTLCLILFHFSPLTAMAEEQETTPEESPELLYFGFEPELVTNYISSRSSMGFVRASIELVVKEPTDLTLIESHEPLLRAELISILGGQPEEKIKSLSGREEIRRECKEQLNKLLKEETGETPIKNLLLTRYIYD